MATILADDQQVRVTVSFVTAKGNPAVTDGVPVWASNDETKATVVADADGKGALVLAVGPLGTVQISVSADADLGTGTRTITGTADFDIQAAEAVAAVIGVGTPEAQP